MKVPLIPCPGDAEAAKSLWVLVLPVCSIYGIPGQSELHNTLRLCLENKTIFNQLALSWMTFFLILAFFHQGTEAMYGPVFTFPEISHSVCVCEVVRGIQTSTCVAELCPRNTIQSGTRNSFVQTGCMCPSLAHGRSLSLAVTVGSYSPLQDGRP